MRSRRKSPVLCHRPLETYLCRYLSLYTHFPSAAVMRFAVVLLSAVLLAFGESANIVFPGRTSEDGIFGLGGGRRPEAGTKDVKEPDRTKCKKYEGGKDDIERREMLKSCIRQAGTGDG
jgi:hypothetical protein